MEQHGTFRNESVIKKHPKTWKPFSLKELPGDVHYLCYWHRAPFLGLIFAHSVPTKAWLTFSANHAATWLEGKDPPDTLAASLSRL
jgi:hypothetical protein